MQSGFGLEQLLGNVYGEEEGLETLRRCHAAVRPVLALQPYAVDSQGRVVCARAGGPRFCELVQSTAAGRTACEQHYASVARAGGEADGGQIGLCPAGLAAWGVGVGESGGLGACGGRIAGQCNRGQVEQLAEQLGLDAGDLLAAFDEVPEHAAADLCEAGAALAACVGELARCSQEALRLRHETELDAARLEQGGNELQSLRQEFAEVSREAFTKNEELLRAHRRLQGQVVENQETFMGFVRALASAIDAKDPYTHNHSQRVTQFALLIGEELGQSEEEMKILELSGLLHDIGKIGMPEAILNKPDRLTEAEFAQVKMHPGLGATIVERIPQLREPARILRHHHERFDGRGYPDGLSGENIPLASRILAVADSFDAITSDRPYRKGASGDQAMEELHRCSGAQFDPQMVTAMEQVRAKGLLPDGLGMVGAGVSLSYVGGRGGE